jgi:hypothetical protein
MWSLIVTLGLQGEEEHRRDVLPKTDYTKPAAAAFLASTIESPARGIAN